MPSGQNLPLVAYAKLIKTNIEMTNGQFVFFFIPKKFTSSNLSYKNNRNIMHCLDNTTHAMELLLCIKIKGTIVHNQ